MKKVIRLGLCMFMAVTLLVGCSSKAQINKNEIKAVEIMDLDEDGIPDDGKYQLEFWVGDWVGIDKHLDSSYMNDTYRQIADKKNISVIEAKELITQKYKNDISSLFIKGNTLIVYSNEQEQGYTQQEYEYSKCESDNGGNNWYIFKLTEGNKEYPFIALSDRKTTESGTEYFALRFGNNAEEVGKKTGSYPIKIPSEVSSEDAAMLIQALEKNN